MRRLRGLVVWLPFGRVPEITAPQLHAWLDDGPGPQLLDVRTPAEWQSGHIEGARNVPLRELPRRLPTLGLETDRTVVAICLSVHRSVPAVRMLKRAGFVEAVQLGGGMRAWREHGLPTVTAARARTSADG